MQTKYDGIILDIDGTIWNTTPLAAQGYNIAIDRSNKPAGKVTAEILQQEFGKTLDLIASDLWPNLSITDRQELIKNCCKEEQMQVANNENDITYPYVIDTVKKLSTTENLFIVSNCQDGYVELTMKKTGLTPYIKDFECFGKTGKKKAENLKMIIERNNLKSPVYVGDTQGDANACAEAGIPFIWAAYGFGKNVQNYMAKIDNFAELMKIIRGSD